MLRQYEEQEPEPKEETSSAPELAQETEPLGAPLAIVNRIDKRRGKRREKTAAEEWVQQQVNDPSTRLARGAMRLSGLSLLLGLPTMALLWRLFPDRLWLWMQVGLFMLYAGMAGLIGALIAMVWSVSHRGIGVPLMEDYEKRDVGTLLDRMMTDLMHANASRLLLTRLLPQLQAEDAGLLEERHYEYLNFYLRQVLQNRKAQIQDKAFVLAILDAYSRIGDPRALRDIERMARSKTLFLHPDPDIREAARRCLPHLEQAAAKAKQHEHLLRPADTPPHPGTLLRPASHSPTADTNILLRPTEAEEAPSLKKPADPV